MGGGASYVLQQKKTVAENAGTDASGTVAEESVCVPLLGNDGEVRFVKPHVANSWACIVVESSSS
jgi:hypothetical protein